VVEAPHAALAVVSRRRLLELLRASVQPLDVSTLAEAVGLHVTTARVHLDVLERAGLVSRAVERAGRPGRPRQLYVAVEAIETDGGHRRLAEALVGVLAADSDGGAEWAERAGQQWAEHQVSADAGLTWEEATREVVELFGRLGFAPRLVDDDRGRHVELDACPFRDLARSYPQVVCTVHAGLLRGALGRLHVDGADSAALRPFVLPDLCIADLPRAAGREDG
jgi:predicted ArsR family transcriptional regulator